MNVQKNAQPGRQTTTRRSLLRQGGAAALGLSFSGGLAACGRGGPRVLNFYNWDTYIGPTTLTDFQRATGVPVSMSTFSSNDQMFAELQRGNPGFDVIVPSNEFVTRMAQGQMLQELDHAKIPNMANLLPEFRTAAFDPGRRYSMPYTWLVLGIGYRKRAFAGGAPDSWRYVFESARHSGRIALISDSADLVRLCAKYLGHSANNAPADMLSRIEQMLVRQRQHVRFHDDDGQALLVAGEADLVLEYNGDIAQIMAGPGGEAFGFAVPAEGALISSDCLCIPAGARHTEEAHAFINYLLDAEVGKKVIEAIMYPTPNRAVRELMPASYRDNPVIFPPPEALALSEYGVFEGAERAGLYAAMLARVRAA